MWRIRRRRSLLVANCLKKLSRTKTIWPVMRVGDVQSAELFFATHNMPVNDFYFSGKIP